MTGQTTTQPGHRAGHGHGRKPGHGPATKTANTRPLTGQDSGPDSGRASGQDSGHGSGRTTAPTAAEWPDNWPRPADPDADTIADTLGWIEAKALAATASASGPVPELGTAAWCALADNDPARWATVCLAAAAWFREYVTTGDRIRTEAREELARFELYASEREQAEADAARAARHQVVKELCAAVDRRTRAAARTDLPNRTGPELIAAAHASWGLAPPVPKVRTPAVPAAGQSAGTGAPDTAQPASPGTIRRAA